MKRGGNKKYLLIQLFAQSESKLIMRCKENKEKVMTGEGKLYKE